MKVERKSFLNLGLFGVRPDYMAKLKKIVKYYFYVVIIRQLFSLIINVKPSLLLSGYNELCYIDESYFNNQDSSVPIRKGYFLTKKVLLTENSRILFMKMLLSKHRSR